MLNEPTMEDFGVPNSKSSTAQIGLTYHEATQEAFQQYWDLKQLPRPEQRGTSFSVQQLLCPSAFLQINYEQKTNKKNLSNTHLGGATFAI
jgi:hypothetical protein